jgi:hypothetical protein
LRNSSSFGFISSYFNHAIIDICSNSDGNVLYQLGQQSTIFITWVQGDSFQHLVSKNDICKHDAQLKDTQIISIYATLPNESRKYQLVGITSTGHRLYFTIYKNELEQTMPNTLDLLHVRSPPSFLGGSLSHKSLYRDAVYLAVRTDTEELIESNPDIGHLGQSIHQHDLVEFTKRIPISGKVLAIESMSGIADDYQVNEIASPLTVAARQFVVFTTTGIFVLVKQRPIDMFQKLIMNSQSDTPTLPEELYSFTTHFGVANTSAFAFAIISDIALTATGVINGAKAVLSRLKNNPGDQFVNQDGLALFIHRTIRPIWENPIFKHDNTSLNLPCQLKSTLETLRHLSDCILE